jgi:hypothetical protein
MSCGCPSTGPEPEIFISGFAKSSILSVDNTHAWLVLLSLNDASAAPKKGLLDVWIYWDKATPSSGGSFTWPHSHCIAFGRYGCRYFNDDGTGGVSSFPWVMMDDKHKFSF